MMLKPKPKFKLMSLMLVSVIILFTACRKEEFEYIAPPTEENLQQNTAAANLLQRTSLKDGSKDNIIDRSNCFTIQLPVTVIANGMTIEVVNENDYNSIEAIFDAYDDDTDTLDIQFPITIILADYTEVVIYDALELLSYSSQCHGENENDDDIECIDFVYPITASFFNTNNEVIDIISINSDQELYDFIQAIDVNDIITINFPITVTLYDGNTIIINSLSELVTTINNFINDCDEDDDYDYNDDDCNNCTPNLLTDILTNCSDWIVDKLERDDEDYDDLYDGYTFNFLTDGTIVVNYLSNTYYGTWIASGTANNITVVIDIPSLPYCNNNWYLHEIQQVPGESKVDLRVGDDDRLRYESTCN